MSDTYLNLRFHPVLKFLKATSVFRLIKKQCAVTSSGCEMYLSFFFILKFRQEMSDEDSEHTVLNVDTIKAFPQPHTA